MTGRPFPPEDLDPYRDDFRPAPALVDWIHTTFVDPDGPLHNDEHAHLEQASIGVLWTTAPNVKQARQVVGMAEMPMFRGHRWAIARQELQLLQWFSTLPDFLITFDAQYAASCDDPTWCALVEH